MQTLPKLIELQRLNVAIEHEAASSFYENFARVFKNSLFGRMSERVSELFGKNMASHYSWSPRVEQDLLAWADRESYMVLGDVTLFVPVGLKVTYLEYLDALENALPHILKLNEELLQPAIETVGVLINNPGLAASKSGLKGTAFTGKLFGVKPEDVAKEISKCFDAASRDDTAKYKQVLKRNQDLSVTVQRLAQLQDNLPLSHMQAVERNMRQLIQLADELVTQMKDDERYQSLSPKMGGMISDQLYQCAVWVEFFAVYQRQVLVLSTALEDSVKKLKKISKK
jgi:hypothetical protein